MAGKWRGKRESVPEGRVRSSFSSQPKVRLSADESGG